MFGHIELQVHHIADELTCDSHIQVNLRDLKPQNIMIRNDGQIKITDFGIAMALNATQLTQTNSVMGSVHYLPPEQASGKGSTIKSDIYSMGIIFYELLTGTLPFRGDNAVEIALKHMREPIPSIREENPSIPQSIENIIKRATAKNLKNRYDSAREMHDDLLTALDDDRMDEEVYQYKYPENESESKKKVKPQKEETKEEFLDEEEPKNVEKPKDTDEEEKILETIQKSKNVIMDVQSENMMSYTEFLFSQFQLIRKRWWVLQAMLLVFILLIMPFMGDSIYMMRTLGIASVFFVVMIIPEVWRNKESNSRQIEVTCLFSLRQIYSARIFLIGMVDAFMITIFLTVVCISMKMQFTDLLVQFLFPMIITAGICFAMLNCSLLNEAISILGCFLWGIIWWGIVMNNAIYERIAMPIWIILFVLAVCFLIGAVYKTIHDCNRFLEVNLYGITNG